MANQNKELENELTINGKTKVCGKEIPNIYGGFGNGQKVILAKTVAEIHERELKEINRLINNHLKDNYFEEGIDYLDLKDSEEFEVILKHHEVFTQNALNRAKNIYLLSQQGYTLLLKLMDTDLARKQYKEVIRKYFKLQESVHFLTKEELERLVAREDGIIRRNRETQAIANMINNGELKNIKCSPYALVTNTTYDLLYGMYCNEIKEYLNLEKQDNLRDFLSKKDLETIREIEDEIHWMHKKGYKWDKIYEDLLREYPDTIVPVKEDKHIKELKKCKNIVYIEDKKKKQKSIK